MFMNVKSKVNFRCLHNNAFLTSLLFVLVLFSSLFVSVFVNCSSGAFLENVVHVKNETELKNAINNASSKENIIALDNDITLTESALTIPYNKDITLTSNKPSGFYKLISGVANQATIVVAGGVLKIDGIIVSGGGDSGIHVYDKGVLVMYDGEISDNTSVFISGFNPFGYAGVGGGVCINSGVFEMYGGKISNNRAQSYGGGVYLGLGAVFSMFGGEISGNTAEYGGGVSNGGNFSMFGGEISGNTAEYGGGVYAGGGYANFSRSGGVISGNTAIIEGNDVYPYGSGDGLPDGSGSGDGESSNGNGGSGSNGGGSSIGGDGGLYSGSGGFSLRDVVFVCVGVALVVVGVVVAVLLFTFKKEIEYTRRKDTQQSTEKQIWTLE